MRLTSPIAGWILWILTVASLGWRPTLVLAQTIKDLGVAQGAQIGHTMDKVPWFNNPDVKAEIKLNENQFNDLTDAYTNYWTRYTRGLGELKPDISEEARRARQIELYDEFQQDFTKSIDDIITDPDSRQRYEQLYRQYQGYGALRNPTLQSELNLTAAQREKLHQYDLEWQRKIGKIREDFTRNRRVAMRELKHARHQIHEQIFATLTPEQQATWKAMTGPRFEFPAQVYLPEPPVPGIKGEGNPTAPAVTPKQ
jgi:hypothetical protein